MTTQLIKEPHGELCPYQTDIGMRSVGRTREEALEQTALALASITAVSVKSQYQDSVWGYCDALGARPLLTDWLNQPICEGDVRQVILRKFKFRIDGHHMEGQAWGEKIGHQHEQLTAEPKVEKQIDGYWIAQCVIES